MGTLSPVVVPYRVPDSAAFLRRLVEVGAVHGSPATRRVLRDLAALLRRKRRPAHDPAPWRAAALGLVDARAAVPQAFQGAEAAVRRLRKVQRGERAKSLHLMAGRARNPALVAQLLEESRRHFAADPGEAHSWLDLAVGIAARLIGTGFPPEVLAGWQLLIAAHRAGLLRRHGDPEAADALCAAVSAATSPVAQARGFDREQEAAWRELDERALPGHAPDLRR